MKRLQAMIGAMLIVLAAAAVKPVAAENVLRWASAGGAQTADPHAYDESPTSAQLSQVYEGLVGLDSNLELVPALAVAQGCSVLASRRRGRAGGRGTGRWRRGPR